MPISPTSAQELRSIIDQHLAAPAPAPAAAAAPSNFCTIWPEAKPVLQAVAGIVGFIPGTGMGAGAALNALLSVGDTIFQQTCGSSGSE